MRLKYPTLYDLGFRVSSLVPQRLQRLCGATQLLGPPASAAGGRPIRITPAKHLGGFTIFGVPRGIFGVDVPSWGPHTKGILLFGDHWGSSLGSPILVSPPALFSVGKLRDLGRFESPSEEFYRIFVRVRGPGVSALWALVRPFLGGGSLHINVVLEPNLSDLSSTLHHSSQIPPCRRRRTHSPSDGRFRACQDLGIRSTILKSTYELCCSGRRCSR